MRGARNASESGRAECRRFSARHEALVIVSRPAWQREDEPGTVIRAGLQHELTLHSTREISADRQTQSQTFLWLRQRSIELDKRLEHIGLPRLRDAWSGVLHAYGHS